MACHAAIPQNVNPIASCNQGIELPIPSAQQAMQTDGELFQQLFNSADVMATESINQQELDQWRQYCQNKLMHGEDQPSISAQDFMITLENLAHEHDDSEKNLTILKALYNYAQSM